MNKTIDVTELLFPTGKECYKMIDKSDLCMIVKTAKKCKGIIKRELPKIDKFIDYIIENKIKDCDVIEPVIDCLTAPITLGLGREQYDKILNYYMTVNSKNATEYIKFEAKYLQ